MSPARRSWIVDDNAIWSYMISIQYPGKSYIYFRFDDWINCSLLGSGKVLWAIFTLFTQFNLIQWCKFSVKSDMNQVVHNSAENEIAVQPRADENAYKVRSKLIESKSIIWQNFRDNSYLLENINGNRSHHYLVSNWNQSHISKSLMFIFLSSASWKAISFEKLNLVQTTNYQHSTHTAVCVSNTCNFTAREFCGFKYIYMDSEKLRKYNLNF